MYIIAILCCICQISAAEELQQVSAILHVSSTVSDGKLSIAEIVQLAKQNNVKVVVLNDHDFIRWEYGLWPLRNVIKRTIARNDVFSYGINKYLKEIADVQKKNPDMVIIPGIESAPFYYWTGTPFKNNLTLNDWHRHMLVVGLDNVQDYKYLPLVSNKNSINRQFCVLLLWPMLGLLLGILCLRKKEFVYKDVQGRTFAPCLGKWRVPGIVIIGFSVLGLINNFPFVKFQYDQYHGKQGTGPYQVLIDHVNDKGGLCFWAHPEAGYAKKIDNIEVQTNPYPECLLETENYSGVALFCEGYKKIGPPGGIWDKVLLEYCQGKRNSPIWAISELDFDTHGEFSDYIEDLRTILLIQALNKLAVLKAMKNGKMYALRGRGEFELTLDAFVVGDSLSNAQGISGDEICIKGRPIIKISGGFDHAPATEVPIKIALIRGGTVLQEFNANSPFSIDYMDDYYKRGEKNYYRLVINYQNRRIVTNPVFVKFEF